MSTGPGAAADSGILGMLPLARSAVDRAAERRTDPAWLAAAWAAPDTRVLPIDDGRALVRFGEDSAAEDAAAAGGAAEDGAGAGGAAAGAAELVFVSPREAPEGVRFLLGVDAAGWCTSAW